MDYHDMLAHIGAGGAHPGGFAATLNFLAHFPIESGARVLEVGCGTGQTACYLAENGCKVTALDIRPKMLEKAKQRAQKRGVNLRVIEGDVRALPLADEQFDVVLGESVTVFVTISDALKEYYRVLAPGGRLIDRELMAVKPIPAELGVKIRELYGAERLPSLDEWLNAIKSAGFREVEVWNPISMADDILHLIAGFDDPSLAEPLDPAAMRRVMEIRKKNDELLTKYEEYHGYGVFMGEKLTT